MTFVFGLIAVGTVLIYSAVQKNGGESVLQTFSGQTKPNTQAPLEGLAPNTDGSNTNDGQAKTVGTNRSGSGSGLLLQLAKVATSQYSLHVSEYPPYGPVHPVHAKNSLHYQGRAFDASGSLKNMGAFSAYLRENYTAQLTEGIHNPGLSVKNGKAVPPSFWGITTWVAHANHVHVGI